MLTAGPPPCQALNHHIVSAELAPPHRHACMPFFSSWCSGSDGCRATSLWLVCLWSMGGSNSELCAGTTEHSTVLKNCQWFMEHTNITEVIQRSTYASGLICLLLWDPLNSRSIHFVDSIETKSYIKKMYCIRKGKLKTTAARFHFLSVGNEVWFSAYSNVLLVLDASTVGSCGSEHKWPCLTDIRKSSRIPEHGQVLMQLLKNK